MKGHDTPHYAQQKTDKTTCGTCTREDELKAQANLSWPSHISKSKEATLFHQDLPQVLRRRRATCNNIQPELRMGIAHHPANTMPFKILIDFNVHCRQVALY